MLLCSQLLLSITLISFHVSASVPGSYDARLAELPARLSRLLPGGLPGWLQQLYCPLQALSDTCLQHSRTYQAGLRAFQPWAVRMLDASSKLPTGLMMGHIHDLGNFDQCFTSPAAPFPLQFCLIDLLNITAPIRNTHPNAETTAGGLPLLKDPKLAFCLPASCSDSDVTTHFSQVTAPWNISVQLDPYSCTKTDSIPLDTLDWVAILVLCILTLLVIISTGYEIYFWPKGGDPGGSPSVLLSFSLLTNGQRLLSTVDPRTSLAYLGGIRFLSMVWVMLGHHMLLNFFIPAINWIVPYKELPRPVFSPLQNTMLAVDTFLVITGMLIAYFFLQEIGTNRRPFKLLPFYLHRFIRVTPTLGVVVLLAATLSSRVGDGPLWQWFYKRHQDYCRTNGWTNLLYLNNYIHTDNQCVSFTWYLCVDMHFYLLSPLVLFPLLRFRLFARVGLPLLILAATSIDFFVAFSNKVPAGSLITRDLRTADNYRLEYTTTHTRAAPWLVGIGLGYVLHSVKATKFKLSQVTVALGWLTAALLAAVSVFGVSYFHQDSQVLNYNALQSSLYISLHRVAWTLAIAWLVFSCETGYAGPVRTFLASRMFQPLGRLAFSLYMVHGGIQYMMVASQKAPAYNSALLLSRDALGELVLAVGQAAILCLGVEAPFIRLEKAIFQKLTIMSTSSKKMELASDLQKVKTWGESDASNENKGHCDQIYFHSKL